MNLGQEIDNIDVVLSQQVLRIGMNRPAKKNALNAPMYLRMAELITAAENSTDVRAIVLTGTQDCFCSGNDVSTFTSMGDGDSGAGVSDTPPISFLKTLAHTELPVVAAVNGPAIGVGTTMLMHCDFIIAGEDAFFQTPFVNLGVCPEAGSSLLLPMQLGHVRAAELLLLGETVDAQTALKYGLVNAVLDTGAYQQHAESIALKLAAQPASSVRATKRLMRVPLISQIEQAMDAENIAFADCMKSPEFAEAITAFMEGRPADFSSL